MRDLSVALRNRADASRQGEYGAHSDRDAELIAVVEADRIERDHEPYVRNVLAPIAICAARHLYHQQGIDAGRLRAVGWNAVFGNVERSIENRATNHLIEMQGTGPSRIPHNSSLDSKARSRQWTT
jgi:hypothetical protein